jgi:hypothetical protein
MSGKVVERWDNGRWTEVFIADRRVEVDHPSGRYRVIAAVPGQELPIAEARRLGLIDKDGKPQVPVSKIPPDKSTVREDVGPAAVLRHFGLIK